MSAVKCQNAWTTVASGRVWHPSEPWLAAGLTGALWEPWDVGVREGVLQLQRVSQHAQAGAAYDGHFGPVSRLRQEPVGRLLVVIVAVDKRRTSVFFSETSLYRTSASFSETSLCLLAQQRCTHQLYSDPNTSHTVRITSLYFRLVRKCTHVGQMSFTIKVFWWRGSQKQGHPFCPNWLRDINDVPWCCAIAGIYWLSWGWAEKFYPKCQECHNITTQCCCHSQKYLSQALPEHPCKPISRLR